jgi:hypothetical protein
MVTGRLFERWKGRGNQIKSLESELKLRGKFFLGLLLTSYVLMKTILYLTRVIAYYFVYGVWKLF